MQPKRDPDPEDQLMGTAGRGRALEGAAHLEPSPGVRLPLTAKMRAELRRQGRATLRGFWVPPDERSFRALVRRGLMSERLRPGLGLLTEAGWAEAAKELSPEDAETATLLASGAFILRFFEVF